MGLLRKISFVGLCALFVLGCATGRGLQAEPPVLNADGLYEISTPGQLLYLSVKLGDGNAPADGHYILIEDIDMSALDTFGPIQDFTGTFDGNYKSISKLTIREPSRASVGLFSTLGSPEKTAVVKNLALADIYVLGSNMVGAVAGTQYGNISGCYVSGEVNAMLHCAGGIAGRMLEVSKGVEPPYISDCISSAAVVSLRDSESQGGICGRIFTPGSRVSNCITTGEVTGRNKTGGLAGVVVSGGVLQSSVAANSWISFDTGGRNMSGVAAELGENAIIVNNLVWDSIAVMVPDGCRIVSNKVLAERSTYETLGWDFDTRWEWVDAGERSYPALKGFANIPYYFDYDWFQPQPATSVSTESTLDKIIISLRCEPEGNYMYAIEPAGRGIPAEYGWSATPTRTFSGLDKASAYEFCYRVKDSAGNESRWRRLTANTGIPVSEVQTPVNISAVVTSDPSTSMTFAWVTMDTTLRNPTVWVTPITEKSALFSNGYEGGSYVWPVSTSVDKNLYSAYHNFHRVTVDGLLPATDYVYAVGDGQGRVVSAERFFTTATQEAADFEFVYMADTQLGNGESAARALETTYRTILDKNPDPAFVFYAGDITEKGYNAGQLARFGRCADTLHSRAFCVVAHGNHDEKEYLTRYFPVPEQSGIFPYVYSFDYGQVHFMVLNTQYGEEDEIEKQVAWLRSDMKLNRRKWNILMFHKALYAATDHVDHKDIDRLRKLLTPAIEELGIDIVLTGHDHCFTRGFIRDGSNNHERESAPGVFINPTAPLYMVNGTAGTSKWYKKINYDASKLSRVSPDYEFIDKCSSTHENMLREQSYSMVNVNEQGITISTYFFRASEDDSSLDKYNVTPYLYDLLTLKK